MKWAPWFIEIGPSSSRICCLRFCEQPMKKVVSLAPVLHTGPKQSLHVLKHKSTLHMVPLWILGWCWRWNKQRLQLACQNYQPDKGHPIAGLRRTWWCARWRECLHVPLQDASGLHSPGAEDYMHIIITKKPHTNSKTTPKHRLKINTPETY